MPGQIYAWDDWFSSDSFSLTQGKDYFCGTVSMAQQIRNAARERSILVSVREVVGVGLAVKIKMRRANASTTINGKK